MGVDLIFAGIHAEVKSLCGERLFLSRLTKMHKKKENNAFGYFCIIQSSQSYRFYITIYVFTEVCRIQKRKKKGLMKLIRLLGNVTDQTEGVREATIVSWLS